MHSRARVALVTDGTSGWNDGKTTAWKSAVSGLCDVVVCPPGSGDIGPVVECWNQADVDLVHIAVAEPDPFVEAAFHFGYFVVIEGGAPSPLTRTLADLVLESPPESWAAIYEEIIGDLVPPAGDDRISVVVTTYRRREWLREVLDGLVGQTLPKERFEVIVVDDCSPDDPRSLVDEFSDQLDLKYVRHDRNRGLGVARNTGVNHASAPIVLLADDDDRPGPRVVAEHLRTHMEHPEEGVAVLGFTGWDRSLEITPLMHHVTVVGCQLLAYPGLRHGSRLEWHCAWGGRVSFKRSMLQRNPFEVSVCEDMELAWRIREKLSVVYNRRAVQYQLRAIDYETFRSRSRMHGRASTDLLTHHPDPELANHLRADRLRLRMAVHPTELAQAEEAAGALIEKSLAELRAMPATLGSEASTAATVLDHCLRLIFEQDRLQGTLQARRELAHKRPVAPMADRKLRVLVVDPFLPLHDRNAGSLRLFNLLKLMVADGHELTYVAVNGINQETYAQELKAMGIEVHATDPERFVEWNGGGSAVDVAPLLDFELLLREKRFDVAWLDFHYIAGLYAPLIRRVSPWTSVIIDTIDVHWLREMRQAELWNSNPQLVMKALATREQEARVYRQADLLVTVTSDDARAAAELAPGIPTAVIGTVHPRSIAAASRAERSGLLFVGNFAHTPNADGIEWFAKEVFPLVRQQRPDVTLTVVGMNPPAELDGQEGVILAGQVPSMEPYLSSAAVSIAPLRFGAGMKGKVGEALAAGLPVVTTNVGAEGMDLVDGRHALIADDALAFSDRCLRLLEDDLLWQQLSTAGLEHVERRYGAGTAGIALREALARSTRKTYFVSVPKWISGSNDLPKLMATWTSAFSEEDPASLVLGVPVAMLTLEAAFTMVLQALTSIGGDPDAVDIQLVPYDADHFRSFAPSRAYWIADVDRLPPGYWTVGLTPSVNDLRTAAGLVEVAS